MKLRSRMTVQGEDHHPSHLQLVSQEGASLSFDLPVVYGKSVDCIECLLGVFGIGW